MEESFGTNAAKPKKRRGPGKPFSGTDDPRRNNDGQRSKEVVQTVAQARALYVQVLAEPPEAQTKPQTKLEEIVRQHVTLAKGNDAIANAAREQMFDRLWGKSAQPVTGPDGGPIPMAFQFVPYAGNDTDNS